MNFLLLSWKTNLVSDFSVPKGQFCEVAQIYLALAQLNDISVTRCNRKRHEKNKTDQICNKILSR